MAAELASSAANDNANPIATSSTATATTDGHYVDHAAATDPCHLSDPQVTPAFPTLEPLSHDLALSLTTAPHFNVDDFLVSRTKAADLSYILSDLRNYNRSLKDELVSIINQDYRDFVSLGSGLKSESHRIARLGWSTSSASDDPAGGGMAPVRDALVRSRETLQSVEDDIRYCMKSREEVGERKIRLELMLQLHESVTRLEELLLIPSSSKGGRQKPSIGAAIDGAGAGLHGQALNTAGEAAGDSGDDDGSASSYGLSSDYEDDEEPAAAADDYLTVASPFSSSPKASFLQIQRGSPVQDLTTSPSPIHRTEKKRRRRRSKVRSTSFGPYSYTPLSPTASRSPGKGFLSLGDGDRRKARQRFEGGNAAGPTSLLGLPQRVARTSAEFAWLRFLSRRVQAESLMGFSNALRHRMEHIRTTLRQDLRALLKTLLSPSSLLVGGASLGPARASGHQPRSPEMRRLTSLKPPIRSSASPGAYELESWSQVAPLGSSEGTQAESEYWVERLHEQRGWLEMVLNTLTLLGGPVHPSASGDGTHGGPAGRIDPPRQVKEAEEAIREIMVQGWASETIRAATLFDQYQQAIGSGGTSNGSTGVPTASASHLGVDAQIRAEAVLLRAEDFTATKGDKGASDDLGLLRLFNSILTFAATDAWHVCDAAESISSYGQATSGQLPPATTAAATVTSADSPEPPTAATETKTTCDAFVNVLWDEVATRLMDDELASAIFFVGRPDTFYRNYTLSTGFLDRFASLAPSPRARAALLRHPHWSSFHQRWQLPVYFQMRFREIVSKLEDGLSRSSQSVSDGRSLPLMQATVSTLAALRMPWSDGVHVHELAAREWRVTLQVLSRYKTWVESEIPDDLVIAALSMGSETDKVEGLNGSGNEGSRMPKDGYRTNVTSVNVSRVPTPTPGDGARTSDDRDRLDHLSSDDATLRHLTSLCVDLLHLSTSVDSFFEEEILPRLLHRLPTSERSKVEVTSDAELVSLLRSTLEETLSYRTSLTDQIGRVVVSTLRTRCSDALRMVRSVSTHYRTIPTASGGGVEASPFIEQLLRPLDVYFGLTTHPARGGEGVGIGYNLPSSLKSRWTSTILSDVTSRYVALLQTMNKNHESLRRLKRGTSSTAAGGALGGLASSLLSSSKTSTDKGQDEAGERLHRQMQRDVEALREGVERFKQIGVEVDWKRVGWERLEAAASGAIDEA